VPVRLAQELVEEVGPYHGMVRCSTTSHPSTLAPNVGYIRPRGARTAQAQAYRCMAMVGSVQGDRGRSPL
jgi:hypothetical protein